MSHTDQPAVTPTVPAAPEPTNGGAGGTDPGGRGRLAELVGGVTTDDLRSAVLLPFLALVTALVLSAVVVAASDVDNLRLLGSDPLTALGNMATSIADAYWSMLVGAVGSPRAISETLTNATPYIIVGIGLSLGFRAGLFNIGGLGQMIVGGLAGTWVGFTLSAPGPIVIPAALAAAAIGGAAYGAIAGFLKARNGAHEVIVTIMLNNIALLGLTFVLKQDFMRAAGRVDPISEPVADSARLPRLLGIIGREELRLHVGILIALAIAGFGWWLLFRSTLGFQFRAVGANPAAARYGGMNVTSLTVAGMGISGALCGIAGANEILGVQGRAAPGFAGSIGFDGISVALLGRNHPVGVVLAGLLFGALRAGGQEMQAATDVPIDMIQIVQALIIIFVAAPALIRALYRIRLEPSDTARGAVAA